MSVMKDNEMTVETEEKRGRFAEFHWHDSEIKKIEIEQGADRWFILTMRIIVLAFGENGVTKRLPKRFRFTNCRSFK